MTSLESDNVSPPDGAKRPENVLVRRKNHNYYIPDVMKYNSVFYNFIINSKNRSELFCLFTYMMFICEETEIN